MIARCGLRTRLPDARSGAGLAGAARPLRRHQGRRDPGAASRGRGAAPHERPAGADLARPRGAQRAGQAAACPAAPAAAGVTPNPAALARQPRCPPLDLPATTARPTTYPAADPGVRAADGPRESPLGVQAHPGRSGRSRPHRGRLDRLPPGRDLSGQDRARSAVAGIGVGTALYTLRQRAGHPQGPGRTPRSFLLDLQRLVLGDGHTVPPYFVGAPPGHRPRPPRTFAHDPSTNCGLRHVHRAPYGEAAEDRVPVVPPRVTVRAGRDESDVAPGLTGATSESSSHRLPSVKSAPCRSVSASANDHRLLTQTCDASPYRGMLRVGAWCSNRGTPAGRTKLLLRFGLGPPVFPCTRSTPCHPRWQGPSSAGSRTRLPTSFALFSALMAGTRLRGDHGCRGVVRRRVGEEGVVIGGLRRARRLQARRLFEGTGNRLRCAAIETPTHRTSWCDPPCPDRVEPSHTVQDPTAAGVVMDTPYRGRRIEPRRLSASPLPQ